MFQKKKFTLVEEKKEKRMYSAKNVEWIKYLVLLALVGFILLMILSNVKSKSYYRNLKLSTTTTTEETYSGARSILSLDEILPRITDCSNDRCVVTCSGDMVGVKNYLNKQTSCAPIKLIISDGSFPNDRVPSNWLDGSFNLNFIQISESTLEGIDSGAFNHTTVANVEELELNNVQLQNLTEDTFVGLNSITKFTLINKIDTFSGNGFLKPMVKALKSIIIKHVSSTATDPAPWLSGADYKKLTSVVLDNSNFEGYINAATFTYLTAANILSMKTCKINYIADGSFDFIMKQEYFFFIDLRFNQLKHLAGDVLTKVQSLKRIDIQNNPWDCTCGLEILIREFKRYPEGFGVNASCSTPTQFAGKTLDVVNVDPCDDTTTASTITTTITTTEVLTFPTTTWSTESSTEESSSSSSTSTSTKLPPTSTTTSTELSVTTTTFSTNSLYTEDSPPSTTALTTLNDEITTPPPQTTPSPQNRTTTMSTETIFIECQRYTIKSMTWSGIGIELAPPDTHFDISQLTQTSAEMKVENPTDDMALIWFYDQPSINGSGENIRIVGEFNVGCQSELEDSLVIEGLAKKRAYTFCLVKGGIQVISPFNCRSYYTSEIVVDEICPSEVWLKQEDKPLTIGLFIFFVIISLCIGIVGMFVVLRFRPTLLKGSKRVIIVNRSTGDVLVMPRPGSKSPLTESSYRNSYETNTTIRQRRFSDTSIQSGRSYMMANNYEDIEYRWKMNVVNDMIYANRVPKSPPPPLPKRSSQDVTKENHKKMSNAVVCQKGNDYGYIA